MLEPFVVDGIWILKAIVAIRSRFAIPLYLEIRKHAFETPECFPGMRRLARRVGCAIGTVSALTDQFDSLGVIRKTHTGQHCLYRFAPGCWRRRKSRTSAHCSAGRTEDKNNYVVPIDRAKNQKTDVSLTRTKRVNMIRSLRRWVLLSPALPDDERGHRLALLDRTAAALDCWHARPEPDRRCFELLVARAHRFPLEPACVQSLRQRPLGMPSLAAVLPALGNMPGKLPAVPIGALS